METIEIGPNILASRIALGTWAIGGWMYGGRDARSAFRTIQTAIDHGISLIDTAPVYGFGRSEEIVGKALSEGHLRSRVLIATKAGLEWSGARVFRNASRARILQEVEDSLRRLRTEHIDVYQVHWPDPMVRIEETAEAMRTLFEQGKIRATGLSNFTADRVDEAVDTARSYGLLPPIALQPWYNLVERERLKIFEEQVYQVAGTFPAQYLFDYGGPWAPFNFAELDLRTAAV